MAASPLQRIAREDGGLVHGPGGLGKTRLMIEVAAALRIKGRKAGFSRPPHEQQDTTLKQCWPALNQLIAHGDDEGMLIVTDYAAGRQAKVRAVAAQAVVLNEKAARFVWCYWRQRRRLATQTY